MNDGGVCSAAPGFARKFMIISYIAKKSKRGIKTLPNNSLCDNIIKKQVKKINANL